MNTRIIKIFIFSFLAIMLFPSFNQVKEEKLKITKENLNGAYGGDEETENAYFGIYEDKIYYPDPNIWVKYELKQDTIITTDDENYIEKWLILKLTTDSLVFYNLNYDMEVPLNRRKK